MTSAFPGRSARRRALVARSAALAVAVSTSFGVLGTGGAVAAPPPPPATAAAAAASWLTTQLADGDHLQTDFGGTLFDDAGLTVDAALAFAAAGVADARGAAAARWLGDASTLSLYAGDGTGELYAGPTAKLALLAQVRGLDATAFGDGAVDLVARVQSREQGDGRFTDLSAFGDFSDPLDQALVILALVRQPGVDPSGAAIDRLLAEQCADGGIAASFDDDPLTCTGSVDQTAYAVQALDAAGRPGDAEELGAALDFLVASQSPDGGFGADPGDAANANSTGLAAQALAVGGRSAAAAAAQAHLVGLQAGCDADPAARGAIAFDATGLDARAARATTQAVLGLAGVGLGELTSTGATTTLPVLPCPQAGYWILEASGRVHAFGASAGDIVPSGNQAPVPGPSAVDVATDPLGRGLWVLDAQGGVHPLGDAPDLGDVPAGTFAAGESATTLSPTPTGDGYWVVTDRGRVVALGAATAHGDLLALALNQPIVDSAATPDGRGYHLLGADGGVFAFGSAGFSGSMGATPLNEPVTGIVPDLDGTGYWLVAGDGGVFAFDAAFRGSIPEVLGAGSPLNAPVQGGVAYGDGYLMVAADGGVFNFGTFVVGFLGSLGAAPPTTPAVAVAPAPPTR